MRTADQAIDKETVARRLKAVRIEEGVDPKIVADRLGITVGTWMNYERGARAFPHWDVPRVALALGVDVEYLTGRLYGDRATKRQETTSRFRPAIGAPQGIGRGLIGAATA